MATTKTIYGQTYISGKSLVQDQILLILTKGNKIDKSECTVVIIDDIWEDLKSTSGTAKEGRPGYWYWESNFSDIEDPDVVVKVKINCPKPGPEVFDNDFTISSGDSDWSKYWKTKMQEVMNSPYNSTNAITPEEVILPGTKYIDQNGNLVILDQTKAVRQGLSDVQNLMMSLF